MISVNYVNHNPNSAKKFVSLGFFDDGDERVCLVVLVGVDRVVFWLWPEFGDIVVGLPESNVIKSILVFCNVCLLNTVVGLWWELPIFEKLLFNLVGLCGGDGDAVIVLCTYEIFGAYFFKTYLSVRNLIQGSTCTSFFKSCGGNTSPNTTLACAFPFDFILSISSGPQRYVPVETKRGRWY